MSKVCQVTGKGVMVGNRVSHSNRKTKRRLLPNLQTHRFWVPSENRFVKLKLSTAGIREIDKRGIDTVLRELRQKGVKV
ncbi:MAG: 50S ribosomal protein L28 [Myxococcota bacterium]